MTYKKTIIAVDDSGIVLKRLENLLSQAYDFHAFAKCDRALTFLETNVPSLILLDIDMPVMNGFQMLKKIRATESLKLTPVIFLTSNNDKEHVIRAVQSGANDYIAKPIDEHVLMNKINTLIYHR